MFLNEERCSNKYMNIFNLLVKVALTQHTPMAVGNNQVGVGIPSTHSG